MGCQSVVERNSDAAGDPWAALDNAAYICFKREVASFVLHDLHSVDPLEEKTPMSPRSGVIGGFVQGYWGFCGKHSREKGRSPAKVCKDSQQH